MLSEIIEEDNLGLELIVVETSRLFLEQIEVLSSRIASLEKTLRSGAKRSESSARLMSMPGIWLDKGGTRSLPGAAPAITQFM
ncbi:hypothetical protein [Nitratireductor luteus]|uniref:hypothetical protein n=1 Tax=Nitratireductor luteus TaxID=2976980 RepID=UPI002240DFCD|nr:hypothetical protein [Nitratireductor luteus]